MNRSKEIILGHSAQQLVWMDVVDRSTQRKRKFHSFSRVLILCISIISTNYDNVDCHTCLRAVVTQHIPATGLRALDMVSQSE